MNKLLEAIAQYGVQCSETKELAPPQYLLDALDAKEAYAANLRAAIGELSQENESMKAQVIKVVRGQFSQICSYCGWEALASGASWDELQVHIKVCPEHPLTKANETIAALQARIAEFETNTGGELTWAKE